jgi:hypothetical protein
MSTARSTAMEFFAALFTPPKKRALGGRRKQLEQAERTVDRFMSWPASGLLRTVRATCLAVNADLHARVASPAVAPSAGVGAPKHPAAWSTSFLRIHWPDGGW